MDRARRGDAGIPRARCDSGRCRRGLRGRRAEPARLCRELAYRMLRHCNFCRGIAASTARAGEKFGACKLASGSRVAPISTTPARSSFYRGTQGSGTIFFTSCNMRCAFCQNGDISTDKDNGEAASRARSRRWPGCCGRRAATTSTGSAASPPFICTPSSTRSRCCRVRARRRTSRRALRTKADWYRLRRAANAFYDGAFNAPMLWNSNFFMTGEAMKLLRLTMDVWLPDFKFGPGRCANELARTAGTGRP